LLLIFILGNHDIKQPNQALQWQDTNNLGLCTKNREQQPPTTQLNHTTACATKTEMATMKAMVQR